MYGVSGAFYQALSMKCDLSRAKLKPAASLWNHAIHMYSCRCNNAIDISLHHIKLKFVQALLIQIKKISTTV